MTEISELRNCLKVQTSQNEVLAKNAKKWAKLFSTSEIKNLREISVQMERELNNEKAVSLSASRKVRSFQQDNEKLKLEKAALIDMVNRLKNRSDVEDYAISSSDVSPEMNIELLSVLTDSSGDRCATALSPLEHIRLGKEVANAAKKSKGSDCGGREHPGTKSKH